MPTRAIGLLLFLPVPLVLFLFTRAPLGILPSLGIGIALMLTHRFYARPWALARAHRRCLWCGADIAATALSAARARARGPAGPRELVCVPRGPRPAACEPCSRGRRLGVDS